MKKLEQLSATPGTEQEAKRLATWLLEWDLFRFSGTEEEELPSATLPVDSRQGESVAPIDEDLAAGEIRLLVPRRDELPLFIAVADIESNDQAVCVPFSPLGEPATPDELLTGRDTPAIRVFCLWNARTLARARISDSWIADKLSTAELERLVQALKGCQRDGHVPSHLRADAGPPLVHPADPRRE
ncbi:MAG: hypothetical protein HN341_03880 [Verrucomicrobia bacterium]|nr:hypothetical protein [Verrucomicrobiota bacterium]